MNLQTARVAYRLTAFTGSIFSHLPRYMAHMRYATWREDTPTQIRVHNARVSRWAQGLLSIFNVQARELGERPQTTRPGGHLVLSNHRSAIDIALLLARFGGHFVARGDLSQWPLLGLTASQAGTLFLDRSSARSGASTLRAMELLLRQGSTVVLFPEGTTFAGDEVRPLHAAAFSAAARAEATVWPVGLAYADGSEASFVGESFGAHALRVARSSAIEVAMAYGAPLPPPPRGKLRDYSEQARAELQRLVDLARASYNQTTPRAVHKKEEPSA